MAQEAQAGQGTIIPSMFIGLGGTGSTIVDLIAAHAGRLPNWETQLRPLTTFVSIDTNELDQHKLTHVPRGNRLNIAAFDKAQVLEYLRRSKDMQALQWLDPGYQPRAGFKPGAGQIRVESRLAFFYHSMDIRQRLMELIADSLSPNITWRQAIPPKYNVYIYCTLAGGTGSGCFLPLAYLVDTLVVEQHWQPRVIGNFLLSTLMLNKVGPELHPDIHANTYAALKELEHLTKLDYPQVKAEGRTSEHYVYVRDPQRRDITEVKSRPYFLSFIVDRPPHLGLPDPVRALADAAFLQIFTPIMDNLAGELDNYEKRMEGLTRFPGDRRDLGLGYTKNFGAFGAAALVLPGDDLHQYAALRFAAEAIRSQITFGVSHTDNADPRLHSLARLAVDYNDPSFLRMGDEGRQQKIQQSFVSSVQELARFEESDGLRDGFWFRLVEGTDEGHVTEHDAEGNPIRSESLIAQVERKLREAREGLLNKISIRDRAFIFHSDSVNQYVNLVSGLSEDIRDAVLLVDEGLRVLRNAAVEGSVITGFKLNPLAERYLLIRIMEQCERTWIPDAQQQFNKAKEEDISNDKVRERLERRNFEDLKQAAEQRGLFGRNRDRDFLEIRDQIQRDCGDVARAARRFQDARIRLGQLQSLLEYLRRRSAQYARLSNRMDVLVRELEQEAERLRRGEAAEAPALALRVEVLETLEEPRRRLWDRVYHELFIRGGLYMATFDREALTAAISRELAPEVIEGVVREKELDKTVADLRRSLIELGRQRTRPAILGDRGRSGLDLVSGIALEARLVLGERKEPGERLTDEEVLRYQEKKLRALSQLAGVLARVSSAETKALDDGVIVNRTRQVVHGLADTGKPEVAQRFEEQMKDVLSAGGRQVKVDYWHDPRLIVVHDVEMPIPLYYFEPVVGEIEQAYLLQAKDERRGYQLHTDFNWEKSLPNLNPRESEITVGWALETLAAGMVGKVIARRESQWLWVGVEREHRTSDRLLGNHLSSALYRLGEIHRADDLRKALDAQLHAQLARMDADQVKDRSINIAKQLDERVEQMGWRELEGEQAREDVLDRPVLRALVSLLRSGIQLNDATVASTDPYDTLNLD